MNPTAVETRSVSYSYGTRRAIDELDLTILEGEVVAILGPNGSGKSTLFRLLSTLIPLQTGHVHILGRNLRSQSDLIRRELGVVFQSPSLDRFLTVSENLRGYATLVGLSPQRAHEREAFLLGALRLEDRANHYVKELSGGLRRRVELARGMIHSPRILLLDEPTTGLDPSARIDFWEALMNLKASAECTVILTTHLLDEADRCERVVVMHEGKIVADGDPSTLKSSVGKSRVTIASGQPEAIRVRLAQLAPAAKVDGNSVQFYVDRAPERFVEIAHAAGDLADSITWGRPSLDDVFMAKTGRRLAYVEGG